MIRTIKLVVMLVGTIVGTSILPAQDESGYSADAEQVFLRAVDFFGDGRFEEASSGFEQVYKIFPPNQRSTAAYVMRAKCLLRLNEPLEAGRTLRTFTSLYPSSSYIPDAEYTMGLVYLKIQRYDDAVQMFLASWRRKAPVSNSALDALDQLIDVHLSVDGIRGLLPQATSLEERAFFWLKIGEKGTQSEMTATVEMALDTLYRNYPENPFRNRTSALRMGLEQRSNVKLGVLLPLMQRSEPSAVKDLGNDIYDGIQFALDEYGKNTPVRVKVKLETRDTERDILTATRGIQELTSDNDIVCIIGPVFSNEAAGVASLANRRGYPLVSPTANANGIAGIGHHIFQANPDYEMRGRAMARYAIQNRGFHIVAVLAPINAFGKYMAEAFAAEALRLGAKVVATEWYDRGAADLKDQLSSVRKAGLKAGAEPMISFGGKMQRDEVARLVQFGIPMKTIDSLMNKGARIGASLLLGPQARRKVDSLGITAVYDNLGIDSLEIPVTAIDGIYIPISSTEEIGIISSQLVYYNIQAQVLGSGEWNNLTELDANKRYCKSVIFESDSYVDAADSAYGKFTTVYQERYKKKPSKNTLYGYDTAAMILSIIRAGGNSREGLVAGLRRMETYRGLHANIRYSGKRVNTWLWILEYGGDNIKMIDGFNVE